MNPIRSAIAVTLATGLFACAPPDEPAPRAEPTASIAADVVRSEIVIEGLRVPLAALSKGVLNLRLPDERGRNVLAEKVEAVDLVAMPNQSREPMLDLGFERGVWPIGTAEVATNADLSLWQPFLAEVDFFQHFNFYNVRGEFRGETRYHTDSGFKGLAVMKSGDVMAVHGKLAFDWEGRRELVGDAEETVWRIRRFETRSFQFAQGPEPLFADVGDIAFETESWQRTVRSPRDEITVNNVLDVRSGKLEIETFVANTIKTLETAGSGVMDTTQTVVVDIDRDGFDDFYVTGAGGPSTFYRNRGDGTFEDQTEQLGLAFSDVYSATFADLDNDGDADLFLSFFNREGATRYLTFEDGRYVDRTAELGVELPNYVIPIAVSDYNNDGLLDVYLATYVNAYLGAMMVANERARAETGNYVDEIPHMDDAVAHDVLRRNRESGHPVSHAYARVTISTTADTSSTFSNGKETIPRSTHEEVLSHVHKSPPHNRRDRAGGPAAASCRGPIVPNGSGTRIDPPRSHR